MRTTPRHPLPTAAPRRGRSTYQDSAATTARATFPSMVQAYASGVTGSAEASAPPSSALSATGAKYAVSSTVTGSSKDDQTDSTVLPRSDMRLRERRAATESGSIWATATARIRYAGSPTASHSTGTISAALASTPTVTASSSVRRSPRASARSMPDVEPYSPTASSSDTSTG
ncbi:hypothetical protein [Streptomyces venezuelae]|uniref:hypothetical protein n=1 Tax=Streptomyces venezuelae TaxID=54571 RepID=UPI003793479E